MTPERKVRVESLFKHFLAEERGLAREIAWLEENLRYSTKQVEAVESGRLSFRTTAEADEFDLGGRYIDIGEWEDRLPIARKKYLQAQRGRIGAAKLMNQ